MTDTLEPKLDQTGTTSDSGKGSPPDVDAKASAEADALKAQLAELKKQNDLLSGKLTEISSAEEKRKAEELEAQGKYKELLEENNRKLAEMEAKNAKAVRRNDILQAVTKCESQIPKAGLMDLAAWVDNDTGGEKPIEEVLKLAEEKAKALQASSPTNAFGSTGGGGSTAPGTTAEATQNLIELGKRAAKTGRTNDAAMYSKARAEYIAKHGEIPPVVRQKIAME